MVGRCLDYNLHSPMRMSHLSVLYSQDAIQNCRHTDCIFCLALPDSDNSPAKFSEFSRLRFVAFHGSISLICPELGTGDRLDATVLAAVRVPKTSMDENGDPIFR